MKNKHSENNLRKEASVFIGTWNMGKQNRIQSLEQKERNDIAGPNFYNLLT